MHLKNRLNLLLHLGKYLQSNDAQLEEIKQKANRENPWFVPEFIELSIKNIANEFLQEAKLAAWLKNYTQFDHPASRKTIGIVMAGNIPLVGFHDMLCVFVSGHKAKIKVSSKDDVLIRHIVQKMIDWDSEVDELISFADSLKNCDAYIATGSNNTSRYFEYYFAKYPSVIRRNRTSVAIIEGEESVEELNLLSDDMQLYFGRGCRNVTKLYVPEQYDFIPLLETVKKYSYFLDFHKYRNNYDYQLALLIMNSKFYMSSDPLIFTENVSVFSPVSQVHYEYYTSKEELGNKLKHNTDIQCIAGRGFIEFGKAQSPQLSDYADGVDTMKFLLSL